MTLVTIPTSDPAFLCLSDACRREAMVWEHIVNAVHVAENKAAVIRSLAREHRGFSKKNIRNHYDRARVRGWLACVNLARTGRRHKPALFVEFCISLCEANKRNLNRHKGFEQLRTRYRRWLAGDETAAIPGYKICPKPSSHGMPAGWTYREFCRLVKRHQSRAEKTLAAQGIAAARKYLPDIPQDVSQVRPLEYVVFDDVEIDFQISVTGSFTPVKLRLLVAMDLCTRSILGFGVRPAITRPDGAEDSLKLRDAKCIVARTIEKWGYPLDYVMTLIVERATMTLKEGDIAALHQVSNGQIKVSLTSMISGKIFEFYDRATGNSWGKAWLESFFNWLHNELGDREGQKGRRYDLAPAELHGRSKELATLMRAGQRMPLSLRHQLRMPFMSGDQAVQEICAAFAKANARTDHNLQGFDQVQEWRFDSSHPWSPAEELPLMADRLGVALPDLSRRAEWNPATRMESPNERMARKIFDVARQEVSPAALRLLMTEHRPVQFLDFLFEFTFEGKLYRYRPNDALCCQLNHTERYLIWFDPQDMERVFLTRGFPHVGYLGEIQLWDRVRRGDLDAHRERMAAVKHDLKRAVDRVAGRNPEEFEGAVARARRNVEILENVTALEVEVDVTPANRAAASPNDTPAVRAMTDRLLDRAHEKETARAEARAMREVAGSLTSEEVAAATGTAGYPTAEDEISSDDMARYFGGAPTEGDQ